MATQVMHSAINFLSFQPVVHIKIRGFLKIYLSNNISIYKMPKNLTLLRICYIYKKARGKTQALRELRCRDVLKP